jgi:hypothetical protein
MAEQTINVTIGEDVINVTLEAGIIQNSNFVVEDQKFLFDGASGDSYFVYNSATSRLELWIDGVKKQQW